MKPALVSLFLILALFNLSACEQPGSSRGPAQTALDDGSGQTPNTDPPGGPSEIGCETNSSGPYAGIVGGQAVDSKSWIAKGIVFVVQEYQVDRDTRTSICTGSLIDRNLVLTAAHCVDRSANNVARLTVYFTHQPECDSNLGRLSSKKKSVAEVKVHPYWSSNSNTVTNRGDLAILRIHGKAPNTYEPLKLAKDFLPLTEGGRITIAGYGMTNPDYYGDFGGTITLRFADALPISSTEKTYLSQLTDDWNEYNNLSSNEMLYIDQSRGKGICGGDSGGPSFLKNAANEPIVTGVASFVMNPRNSNRLCAYVAAHTSTFFHKLWIENTFKAMRTAESSFETPFR
jgi:secreted trypsin-like serine protease